MFVFGVILRLLIRLVYRLDRMLLKRLVVMIMLNWCGFIISCI